MDTNAPVFTANGLNGALALSRFRKIAETTLARRVSYLASTRFLLCFFNHECFRRWIRLRFTHGDTKAVTQQ